MDWEANLAAIIKCTDENLRAQFRDHEPRVAHVPPPSHRLPDFPPRDWRPATPPPRKPLPEEPKAEAGNQYADVPYPHHTSYQVTHMMEQIRFSIKLEVDARAAIAERQLSAIMALTKSNSDEIDRLRMEAATVDRELRTMDQSHQKLRQDYTTQKDIMFHVQSMCGKDESWRMQADNQLLELRQLVAALREQANGIQVAMQEKLSRPELLVHFNACVEPIKAQLNASLQHQGSLIGDVTRTATSTSYLVDSLVKRVKDVDDHVDKVHTEMEAHVQRLERCQNARPPPPAPEQAVTTIDVPFADAWAPKVEAIATSQAAKAARSALESLQQEFGQRETKWMTSVQSLVQDQARQLQTSWAQDADSRARRSQDDWTTVEHHAKQNVERLERDMTQNLTRLEQRVGQLQTQLEGQWASALSLKSSEWTQAIEAERGERKRTLESVVTDSSQLKLSLVAQHDTFQRALHNATTESNEAIVKLKKSMQSLQESIQAAVVTRQTDTANLLATAQSSWKQLTDSATALQVEKFKTLETKVNEMESLHSYVKNLDAHAKTLDGQVRTVEGQLHAVEGQLRVTESHFRTIDGSLKAVDSIKSTLAEVQGVVAKIKSSSDKLPTTQPVPGYPMWPPYPPMFGLPHDGLNPMAYHPMMMASMFHGGLPTTKLPQGSNKSESAPTLAPLTGAPAPQDVAAADDAMMKGALAEAELAKARVEQRLKLERERRHTLGAMPSASPPVGPPNQKPTSPPLTMPTAPPPTPPPNQPTAAPATVPVSAARPATVVVADEAPMVKPPPVVTADAKTAKCSLCNMEMAPSAMLGHEQSQCPMRFEALQIAGFVRAKELTAHEGVCAKTIVKCKHCLVDVAAGDLPEHELQCDQVMKQCPHCLRRQKMSELQEHINVCDCRLVQCPNQCGGKFLQRGLEKHVLTKCPKRAVVKPEAVTSSAASLPTAPPPPAKAAVSNDTDKQECKYCDESYGASEIEEHEQSCDWKPKRCQYCNMVIISRDLARHEASCKQSSRQCAHCQQSFPSTAFAAHMPKCAKRPIKCIRCGELFPADVIVVHSTSCKPPLTSEAKSKAVPPPPSTPPPAHMTLTTSPKRKSESNLKQLLQPDPSASLQRHASTVQLQESTADDGSDRQSRRSFALAQLTAQSPATAGASESQEDEEDEDDEVDEEDELDDDDEDVSLAQVVAEWSVENVCLWLKEDVGVPDVVDRFDALQIDGQALLDLTEAALISEIGIKIKAHRDRILAAIEAIKSSDDYSSEEEDDEDEDVQEESTEHRDDEGPAFHVTVSIEGLIAHCKQSSIKALALTMKQKLESYMEKLTQEPAQLAAYLNLKLPKPALDHELTVLKRLVRYVLASRYGYAPTAFP
ncbi:hypothetical protein ACHHYP_16050 [Achlya hypogyna]|uniref:SAM domain-containing protein n=1 Tax=Achlya hypogyna TaxID=1202772 RepID=A0A1V9Y9M5_ACHHY|nr:hypothetical protein ACHHYP_16050 [Achlya hypogyna]